MSYKSSLTSEVVEQTLINAMRKDNEQEYTPTKDYHPATKKYVDEHAGSGGTVGNVNLYKMTKEQYMALESYDENALYILTGSTEYDNLQTVLNNAGGQS